MTTDGDTRTSEQAASLAPLLHDARVSWDALTAEYGPLLRLVETVLGVVPNCDRYLEIWPPAFRSYNVMVPNFLNLPVPVFGVGGPPPAAVGLAMYVASRTAACPYCSAHSCSFAMRRGAPPDVVAAALLPDAHGLGRGELATVAVAKAMARVPAELTPAERQELEEVYGEKGAEWIAVGAAMMGFLNKFMDGVGVELEQSVVSETVATLGAGWSAGKAGGDLDPATPAKPAPTPDGLRTKLRLLPLLPAAIRFDRKWQRDTPARPESVGRWLVAHTGHGFPTLARLHSNRVRRAAATMLRDNLDAATSVVGLDAKVLAGAVYAAVVQDDTLAGDVRALAPRAGVTEAAIDAATSFAQGESDVPAPVSLVLARAVSSSPARIDATTVRLCQSLAPSAIVEIVSWLSVLQMLHRLTVWTGART